MPFLGVPSGTEQLFVYERSRPARDSGPFEMSYRSKAYLSLREDVTGSIPNSD